MMNYRTRPPLRPSHRRSQRTSVHARQTLVRGKAMNVMAAKLREERESKEKFIEGLADTAASENRDLSSNELELITRAKDRVAAIDEQVKVLARESTLDEAAQQRLAQLAGAAIGGAEAV